MYIDLDASLSLRPDGHLLHLDGSYDCYHYCIPGPLDQFMHLLYNVLLLLDARSQAKR